VNCIFFFDGLERPECKRGRQVITREPDYYKHAKSLIECFGYYNLTACGDAEAELADLNRRGIIDAVLTKDSDVFPFGAQCILVPNFHKDASKELTVDVYLADTIQDQLELSRAGFILISLLLQSDSHAGVAGIGPKTALGLARCGFGDSLLAAYEQFSNVSSQLSHVFQKLNQDMANEIQFDTHAKIGSRSPTRADVFRNSAFPSVNDMTVLNSFLSPPLHQLVSLQCPPRIPDLMKISSFCRERFSWPVELTSRKFHNDLWPALIGRMLCSVSLNYLNPLAIFIIILCRNTLLITRTHPKSLSLSSESSLVTILTGSVSSLCLQLSFKNQTQSI
ncbi:PIN domain-like protein, partial [Lentinula raphanica]